MLNTNYREQLKPIEARLKEIKGQCDAAAGEELQALLTESEELTQKRSDLLAKIDIAERGNFTPAKTEGGMGISAHYDGGFSHQHTILPHMHMQVGEQRGKDLKDGKSVKYEARAMVIGTSNIVLPQHQANTINPTFNQVSSLIDHVDIMPLPGGETFDQPYAVQHGEGDYTAMSTNYHDVETVFDYATVSKTKVTAYEEAPEELVKLAHAPYDLEIQNSIRKALRRKLTREILIGDGASGHFVGIFGAPAAIDAAKDQSIAAIDEFTLDEIIYSYGGEEDVESVQALILSKPDLLAFSKVRDANGNRVYSISHNGNTGMINGVSFILNSACKPLSDTGTASGDFVMTYGNLKGYMMAVFSDVEVMRSTDYKFKQGQICHKGVVFAGGNVVSKDAFLRIKKA